MLKDRTIAYLMLFIELRSCKKPVSGKSKAFYVDEVGAVFGQESRLALGSTPEGFAAWLSSDAAVL